MGFREEMIKLITENTPVVVIVCEVMKVDEDKRTCSVKDLATEMELYDIKLQGSLGLKEGLFIVPKLHSKVLVTLIGNDERNLVIFQYSEIEKIEIRGSKFGGLIKIEELKTQIDKNSSILDALMQILSGSPIPEPGSGSPSALQIALKAVIAGKTTADLTDIENKEVQHG